MGEIVGCFSALLSWRKGKLGMMNNGLVSLFAFLHDSNAEKPHQTSQSQQRLHKLCFLQKLGFQKPCCNQAGLSSLVNKQVVDLVHIWFSTQLQYLLLILDCSYFGRLLFECLQEQLLKLPWRLNTMLHLYKLFILVCAILCNC